MLDEKERETIPAWEWGPGSIIDFENNTLYGVSGTVYRGVQVKKSDIEELIKKMRN